MTPRHVAILDEAAMADDAALVAFLESARTTGAKVVAVGDPRQLSSVGPGGGFEALVSRFGGAVHVLTENVRQVDRLERSALNHLGSGDVEAAVAWYSSAGRIAVSPDRDTALDATVAGWATDVSDGEHAAMYAWKRANVAELNRRGRMAWEEMGRLSGPELVVGETSYRAGDRIVARGVGGRGPRRSWLRPPRRRATRFAVGVRAQRPRRRRRLGPMEGNTGRRCRHCLAKRSEGMAILYLAG
ncbi:MAG TPA: AAA family ATPase [Acidimicrobiales bacterium]|jgi:hypothetical protein